MQSYQCIIVGGGIAGLQAAIQLGRYNHDVLVIDRGEGRSTLCRCYHNVLGWPDGVEGETLRALGRKHAEKYQVKFVNDEIIEIQKLTNHRYLLTGKSQLRYETSYLLLATGVTDNLPLYITNLKECLGESIYICPDCDGYEVTNKRVVVAGCGDVGAKMALTLKHWTQNIIYINTNQSQISAEICSKLKNEDIPVIHEQIGKVDIDSAGQFSAFITEKGTRITGDRGFLAFGGNKVNTNLLQNLGVERLENKHILTNMRTKETNIRNIWVAGDISVHSELLTIAMGEGAQAAIWIHKRILEERD